MLVSYKGCMSDFIIVVIAISWLMAASFTASHASANNKSGIFWGVFVLLTGIIGLVIYAISLAGTNNPVSSESSKSCPECGVNNMPTANFCHNCSKELADNGHPHIEDSRESEGKYFCTFCDGRLETEDKNCSNCGGRLI